MSSQRQREDLARRFQQVFGPEFSDEEVLGFLPYVFIELTHADPGLELPPHAVQFMADFAGSIGIQPEMSPDEAWRRVEEHQRMNPPCGELKVRFEQLVRQVTSEVGTADGERYLGFLGEKLALTERAEPAEDAVGSGPFARFQLREWKRDS